MKRIVISILIIIIIDNLAFPQQVYFNNRYQFNDVYSWCPATSLICYGDKYLITGATFDTINQDWRWVYLSELSETGEINFIKYIGNNSNDFYPAWPGSFKRTDSNVFFTGNKVYFQWYHTAGLLIKLSTSLDTIWSKEYFGDKSLPYDSNQHFNNMDICDDGGFIFTGEQYYDQQPSKTILLRTDANGTQKWVKHFGSSGLNAGYSVIQTTDGGFAIGGFWYVPGSPYYTGDPIVIKTDSLGNKEWEKNLGGPYLDNRAVLSLSHDGNIIAVSDYADSLLGSDQPYNRTSVVMIDNGGNFLWSKKWGKSEVYNFFKNIRCLNDGSFILCGLVPAEYPHYVGWLLKIDADGDSVWYRQYKNLTGWQSENNLEDVIPTPDNGFLACGKVFPWPPDTGTQGAWIIKLDSMGCDTPGCAIVISIPEEPLQINNDAFLIYPNPASSEVRIDIRYSLIDFRSSIFIYDIFGRKQEEIRIPADQNQVRIDVSTYPAGVYIAILKNERSVLGRRKFVVSR